MPVRNALSCLLFGALVACATFRAHCCAIQPIESASGYNQPPKNILDVMRAPSPPVPRVSPTQDTILLVSWQDYPPISRVATPFLRLAGVRVEPKNHSKHDTPGGYGITPCARASNWCTSPLLRPKVLRELRSCFPWARAGHAIWAADGKRFAFVNLSPEAVELWIGDAKTGEVHQVPGARLNPMFEDEMQWMPDQKTILVKLVPRGWARRRPSQRCEWSEHPGDRRRKRAEQHL